MLQFIAICIDLTNEFLDKNGPQLAAAIAFFGLFSLFPLFLALMSFLGFFLHTEGAASRLAEAIKILVPVSQDSLSDTLKVVVSTRHITGALGVAGLLWASTTVFGAIRKGINALWGIKRPRPFFHERFLDAAFTAGAGLLMMAPMALTAGTGFFGDAWATTSSQPSTSGNLGIGRLATYLSPAISLVAFMFLYRYLPNTKVTFRDVWPGALLATFAFEATKAGFLWYAGHFPIYNALYGPVGALAVLLTWAYVSALVLLYGAMVTSRYSRHLSRKAEEKGLQLLASFKKMMVVESKE